MSTAFAPPSEEGAPSPLERLPNEILAKIAKELPSGDREDPSPALQAMRNLVQTSKKMYQTFNSLYVTRIFLSSFAEKYEERAEECAAQLNTSGARRFLQNYICENALDEAHAIIEELKQITFHLFEQAKKIANRGGIIRFPLQSFKADNYSQYASRFQTEKGFLICINRMSLRVFHPFGVITIRNWDCYRPELFTWIFSIAEVLLHRLEGTFRGMVNIHEGQFNFTRYLFPHQHTIRRVPPSQCPNKIRKIGLADMPEVDLQNLEEFVGTRMLIVSTTGPSYSSYDLHRIFGKTLPKSEFKTHGAKSTKLMKTIVSMLK